MGYGDFAIRVESLAGLHGETTPLRFELGRRRVEVAEVLDRWLGSARCYFKVRGDDGDVYILLHQPGLDRWELTLFSRASPERAWTTPAGAPLPVGS